MSKAVAAVIAVVCAAVVVFSAQAGVRSAGGVCARYAPHVPSPAHFSQAIDNAFFPLPVGRTFIYRGVENGKKELDRMRVTARTRNIAGITATVVSDNVYEPTPKLAEKTFDYYAQDDRGNVWYLGEDTKELLAGGKVDSSGSWLAGKDGAKPGLIMEATPRVPDAYRQECLSGDAEDLAWVVSRSGSKVTTMEYSPLEPAVVERKIYKRGVGVVSEHQLSGGHEVLSLVRVSGWAQWK
jgi:hypothetical protein